MEVTVFFRALIMSAIVFMVADSIIQLISMELERRWNKLNKDIDKMIDDLREEREDLEKELNKWQI